MPIVDAIKQREGISFVLAVAIALQLSVALSVAQVGPTLEGCPVLPVRQHLEHPGVGPSAWPRTRPPSSTPSVRRQVCTRISDPGYGTAAPSGSPTQWSIAAQAGSRLSRFDYADESDPGPYPIPPDALIEGGSQSSGRSPRAHPGSRQLRPVRALLRLTRSRMEAGRPAPAPFSILLRTPCGRTAGHRRMPLGCRFCPGWSATTRWRPARSGTRCASRPPRPAASYVWPARHEASNLTGSQFPPMGQRFRLKAGFDLSRFSAPVQVILQAMKTYGLILADNGSAWYISGVPGPALGQRHAGR